MTGRNDIVANRARDHDRAAGEYGIARDRGLDIDVPPGGIQVIVRRLANDDCLAGFLRRTAAGKAKAREPEQKEQRVACRLGHGSDYTP